MNVEEIRKKVRSLCEDAGLQFFFAVPNVSEWAVTDCEHLRKIVSYHKELETLPLVTPTQNWISADQAFNHGVDYCINTLLKQEPAKAISLDKVKQAREEISDWDVNKVMDGCSEPFRLGVARGLDIASEILDKLIKEA